MLRPVRLNFMAIRLYQLLLIASIAAFCWLGMMVVHELGHAMTLGASGGTVTRVVLHPLGISRTDPGKNPHPLFVAWGGAVLGSLLPLFFVVIFRRVAARYCYLASFFAGYCLIANGAYLVGGAIYKGGDAVPLLDLQWPVWPMAVAGIPAVILGLYLWNGLGPHFGLGHARGQVDRRAAVAIAIALVVLVLTELLACGP